MQEKFENILNQLCFIIFRAVVVQDGEEAKLICHASGSPLPSVSWRRQNNAILPTGGIQVF